MAKSDSKSNFDIDDLMNDYYSNGFHYVLDPDPDNFVEVFATFLGQNGLQVSFSVNNRTVSVQNHILDNNGNFNLSNMVNIERYNLTDNTSMIDIIYNRSVIYTYPHVHPPNDRSNSDTSDSEEPEEEPMDQSDSDSESLPDLEPSDHDEEPVAEEPAAEAAASSADAEEPAATAAAVEFLQGYDTPYSPLGSDDEDFLGFSSLFGCSNPPSDHGLPSDPLSPSDDRPPSPDEDAYSMDGMAGSNPPSDHGLPSDPPSDDRLPSPDHAVDSLDGSSSTDFFIVIADREE